MREGRKTIQDLQCACKVANKALEDLGKVLKRLADNKELLEALDKEVPK